MKSSAAPRMWLCIRLSSVAFQKQCTHLPFTELKDFFVDISLRSYHTIRRTVLTRPSEMSRFEEKTGQEDFVFEIR